MEQLLKRQGLAGDEAERAAEGLAALRAVIGHPCSIEHVIVAAAVQLGAHRRDDGTLGWGPFSGDNVRNAQLLLGAVLK